MLNFLQAAKHRSKLFSRLKQETKQTAEVQSFEAEPSEIINEGYLHIATDMFNNKEKFPDVPGAQIKQIHSMDQQYVDELFKQGIEVRENSLVNSQFKINEEVPSFDSYYITIQGKQAHLRETSTDTVILGNINIVRYKDNKDLDLPNCLEIGDIDKEWLLCTSDQDQLKKITCDVKTLFNEKCEDAEQEGQTQKLKMLQPLMIIPLPSPNCDTDWNYNFHGNDWVCRCNEGLEQSPIDLPHQAGLELLGQILNKISSNASFDYVDLPANKLITKFERNMVRIKTSKDIGFGTITDTDGTVYKALEMQIHTPAEHTYQGMQYDMEIQIIHEAVEGNMKYQAVLSFIYDNVPGANSQALKSMNLLDLPNMEGQVANEFFDCKFNLNKFFQNQKDLDDYSFSYYKYQGSMTSPPCAENVVWFVASEKIQQGSTYLNMFRDALNAPGKTANDKGANYDGNNRKVLFYDKNQSCENGRDQMAQFTGHFEKLIEPQQEYIYLMGQKPSGIPNAQVVSESEATEPIIDKIRKSDRYDLLSP